jgi:4'-phosphopantetheinyl transferase
LIDPNAAPLDQSVHLWLSTLTAMKVDSDGVWLTPAERRHAETLRSEAVRARFVLTRSWLRGLLGRYLNAHPGDIELDANEHGKPRLAGLADGEGLVFNLSHSGEFAALAFARDTLLGVDIEVPRERRNLGGMAAICLSPAELTNWQARPPDLQLAEFLRLWVCKEAFVKAVGRGLALGLRRVTVHPDAAAFSDLPPEYGPPSAWHLYESKPSTYRLAVVFKGEPRAVVLCEDLQPGITAA